MNHVYTIQIQVIGMIQFLLDDIFGTRESEIDKNKEIKICILI